MNKQNNIMMDAASIKRSLYSDKRRGDGNYSRIFTALLFLLFIAALLIALVIGTNVYSSLQHVYQTANGERLANNLVANVIHANDAVDSIAVGKGPEGKSLVLIENTDNGTFETRGYLYKGKIIEEYSMAGTPYTPERATEVIVPSDIFDFSYANGCMTIVTDQGETKVALRSVKGGM